MSWESARRRLTALRAAGRGAPSGEWSVRHHVVLGVAAAYLPVIAIAAVRTNLPADQLTTYMLVTVLLGVLSMSPKIHRSVRSTLGVGALLTANVALIEATGRAAVTHLMFAFVLVLVAFYQSWFLQLFATAYVTVYYVGLGLYAPQLIMSPGMVADPSAPWPVVIWAICILASVPAVAAWIVVARANSATERLSAALAEAALRERSAAELNDTVMQDLVTALYAAELGDQQLSIEASRRAVESARRVVDDLLGAPTTDTAGSLDLTREEPAQAGSEENAHD